VRSTSPLRRSRREVRLRVTPTPVVKTEGLWQIVRPECLNSFVILIDGRANRRRCDRSDLQKAARSLFQLRGLTPLSIGKEVFVLDYPAINLVDHLLV
jgi:hypothetical protein